jgi:hypothetical protein
MWEGDGLGEVNERGEEKKGTEGWRGLKYAIYIYMFSWLSLQWCVFPNNMPFPIPSPSQRNFRWRLTEWLPNTVFPP